MSFVLYFLQQISADYPTMLAVRLPENASVQLLMLDVQHAYSALLKSLLILGENVCVS